MVWMGNAKSSAPRRHDRTRTLSAGAIMLLSLRQALGRHRPSAALRSRWGTLQRGDMKWRCSSVMLRFRLKVLRLREVSATRAIWCNRNMHRLDRRRGWMPATFADTAVRSAGSRPTEPRQNASRHTVLRWPIDAADRHYAPMQVIEAYVDTLRRAQGKPTYDEIRIGAPDFEAQLRDFARDVFRAMGADVD
jgi:hypothetical protein